MRVVISKAAYVRTTQEGQVIIDLLGFRVLTPQEQAMLEALFPHFIDEASDLLSREACIDRVKAFTSK